MNGLALYAEGGAAIVSMQLQLLSIPDQLQSKRPDYSKAASACDKLFRFVAMVLEVVDRLGYLEAMTDMDIIKTAEFKLPDPCTKAPAAAPTRTRL